MSNKKYRDENWLKEKYIDMKLSMPKIAEMCDCYPTTIKRWLDKFDIETRGYGDSKYHDDLGGKNNPFYGETHSDETKRKLSKSMKKVWRDGKVREKREEWLETEEAKKIATENLPDNNEGKNNGNWKGGVYEKYYDGTYGWKWTKIREKVLERDNYECQKCGLSNHEHINKYKQGLQIHHKIEYPKSKEHNLDNLISLCVVCHNKVHANKN